MAFEIERILFKKSEVIALIAKQVGAEEKLVAKEIELLIKLGAISPYVFEDE